MPNEHQAVAPDRASAIRAIQGFTSEENAQRLWRTACKAVSVSEATEDLDEISQVMAEIAKAGGEVAIAARSMSIRIRTHKLLSRTSATAKRMDDRLRQKLSDASRLREIYRLRLHLDDADEILQDYVEKAAKEFDLPVGLVSIVMDEAQKFAASTGLDGWLDEVQGTPVEWSFCANSVVSGKPFTVEDAPSHDKVKDNPLVTEDGIKCYAGAPLVTKKGQVIGNFCVIGDKSRSFTQEEVERLREYAGEVMNRLEARVE